MSLIASTNSWELVKVIKHLDGDRFGLLDRAVSYAKAKGV